MNKLTEEEISKYVKEKNELTGVDGISREYLESIDLDQVPEVDYTKSGKICVNGNVYRFDAFTPAAESECFQPSFAGSQILIGRRGRSLIFSNGHWFREVWE